MTKLFKNSKSVLSCVLAFAVLAVSLFTGVAVSHIHADAATDPVVTAEGTVDLLEFGSYLTDAGSSSQYYDSVLADNGETGADWDNAIIIDSAEEMVYLCKASGNDTIGKYYKVADGIAGFNFATSALDLDGTLADNLNAITGSGKNHAGNTPGFQGHFDGNGATVYGAWTNPNNGNPSAYVGLFSCTKGEVTIKNIHVNKAYFIGSSAAGGIVGYHNADSMCTVTIENCSVTDSYLEVTKTVYGTGVGAILGFGASAPSYKDADGKTVYVNVAYNIKNCYVNLDEANFVSLAEDGTVADGERVSHGGVAGVLGSNALMVSDCVVIGITPYATSESTAYNDVQHSALSNHFANVYTDQATGKIEINGNTGWTAGQVQDYTGKVFQLTDDQLKGAAVVDNMDLDWTVWMADSTGYPELANAHKNVTLVDNGNGTHAATCACGFGGIAVDCTYVDGTCACGAELNCATRKTIYWDGTVASGIATGTGTKDDPYIIKSAAEFAWLVRESDVDGENKHNSTGKYYEIDESIGKIVLQPAADAEAIIALDSAAAVKAYFETGSHVEWIEGGWETQSFAGNFDGNGVTVYGLYSVSAANAGLFNTIDGGAAIKNIALKNSYLTSTNGTYQVGGIAAVTSSASYGAKTDGAIWFEGCVVANNYMYNSSTANNRSGVVVGASGDVVYMDNCLVYGNDATYGENVNMAVWGGGNNSVIVSDSFVAPEGLELVNDGAETARYYNMIRNSVIFGTKPYDLSRQTGSRFNDPKCYSNVLTDADVATDTFSNSKVLGATEEQIKTVAVADLATAELGDAWINTTSYPELRSFHDATFANVVDNGDGTHSATCSCGLAINPEGHTWVDGNCSVCGAGCEHDVEFVETTPADCTNNAIGDQVCKICGFKTVANESKDGTALGHDLVEVPGTPADCDDAGVKTYYDCSRCDFVSEDAEGTKAIDNLDEWKVIEALGHTADSDDSGIIYATENGVHYNVCKVCDTKYGGEVCDGPYVADGANGCSGICNTCGVETVESAEHAFNENYECSRCGWSCEDNHTAGEAVKESVVEKTCTEDGSYDSVVYCSVCGYEISRETVIEEAGHTVYYTWTENPVPACLADGSYDTVGTCAVCEEEVRTTTVVPKQGHIFNTIPASDPTCTWAGNVEYKTCYECWKDFAADEEDIYSEDYITAEDYEIAINPDAHIFEEHEAVEATCDTDGMLAYKQCIECDYAVSEDGKVEATIEVDEEAFEAAYAEQIQPLWMEFYMTAYPTFEEYIAAQEAIMTAEEALRAEYVKAAAVAAGFGVEASHELVEVKEVAATYEAEGTKAHYACEACDKLFADAEGKEEVTAESLVIAKLVKEEEKVDDKTSTDDKKDDATSNSDKSDESPKTGESVAAVAAVAALMGAAFVLVRKARKA